MTTRSAVCWRPPASGASFATYVGKLDQLLKDLIDELLARSLDGESEAVGSIPVPVWSGQEGGVEKGPAREN